LNELGEIFSIFERMIKGKIDLFYRINSGEIYSYYKINYGEFILLQDELKRICSFNKMNWGYFLFTG
jgi:hypothetical protein